MAVLASETDSSEDLVVCGPEFVQKYALAATFWAKPTFLYFQVLPPPKKTKNIPIGELSSLPDSPEARILEIQTLL